MSILLAIEDTIMTRSRGRHTFTRGRRVLVERGFDKGALVKNLRNFGLPYTLLASVLIPAACGLDDIPPRVGSDSEPSRHACSSINLTNLGYSVFGKNLDNSYTTEGLILVNPRGIERTSPHASTTGARAQWISRYASVNFAFVHVGFVWTGMNEKGLVISMMGIPETEGPPPDERPPLVDGLWIQYMLDTCASVDEVLEAAKDVRILTVDHYHIADRYGTSAAFEFLDGQEVVYVGEDFPVSVLTNSTYEDSIHDWVRYNENPFFAPNGSLRRFRIAAERLQEFEQTNTRSAVDYAFNTLEDISSELIYGFPNSTQWSIVFDTRNRRVFFRTFSHPDVKFFDLLDFDFECGTPVKMLNVQTPLSGNVFPLFEDLTFDAACEHYRHFKESWQGLNPSQREIEDEIRYYMDFPCVGVRNPIHRPSARQRAAPSRRHRQR